MEILVFKIFAILRPIMMLEIPGRLAALNLLEASAIFLSLLIILAYLIVATLHRSIKFGMPEIMIVLFTIWCITSFVVADGSTGKETVRMLLPLWTFVMVRTAGISYERLRSLLLFFIVGYTLPAILSTGMAILGLGVGKVNYWTKVVRFEGLYLGAHDFALNMFLFLSIISIYILDKHLHRDEADPINRAGIAALFFLVGVAVYAIFVGAKVRTAVVGVIFFWSVVFWKFNRRVLIYGIGVAVVFSFLFLDKIIVEYFPDLVMIAKGEGSLDMIGSGRLQFWSRNVGTFLQKPFEVQLVGIGPGAEAHIGELIGGEGQRGVIYDTHNDWLKVLFNTGYVGFLLYAAIQAVIFVKLLNGKGELSVVYLALFIAVQAMNLASNAYVSRFGLGQMYYMLMAIALVYVEESKTDGDVSRKR